MNLLRRGFRWILALFNEILFRLLWIFGGALLFLYFRLSATNRPKIRGAYILASNHASLLDGVVLQAVLWRRITYLLTVLFYRMTWLRWFFQFIQVIPVYEGGGNKNALFEAAQRLRHGAIVGIFPEGGVATNGELGAGRPGVAILAESAQVPVVPVAICGAYEAMPRGSIFPKPRRVRVHFGEPIAPLPKQEGPRRERYRDYTERIMKEISLLQEK